MLEYCFEEVQELKFLVYDVDDKRRIDDTSRQEFIGETECTLAAIVSAGQCYDRKLRNRGKIITFLLINYIFNFRKPYRKHYYHS